MPAVKESKTLFHSALSKMGEVAVEVVKEAQQSKYPGKPDYVTLKIDGKEWYYSCENPSCAAFFEGTQSQTILLQASGRDEDAILEFIDQQQTPAAPPPRAAARPPARQSVPPPQRVTLPAQNAPQRAPAAQNHAVNGQTVGMALKAGVDVCMKEGSYSAERVAQVASDLLRLSRWLEQGNLVPKVRQPAAPEPPPQEMPADMNQAPGEDPDFVPF